MNPLSDNDAAFASEQLVTGCNQMESLLKGLLDSKGRVAEEVHTIRKLGKSLRGGFSLFRLGETSAKEIQAIGRLLSSPRDAVSRLSTWNKLGWEGDALTAAAIFGLLDQQTHSAARRPPPETISWCVERVTIARSLLQELPATTHAERMTVGIRKLGKQVIKRCRRLDQQGEEDFHDARKALKAYLGALQFLPENTIPKNPVMAELAELLGDENDLATLSFWLEGHGFTSVFAPDLWKTLENRRKAIREQAMKDAVKLVTKGGSGKS
jgi:hypothetical protein